MESHLLSSSGWSTQEPQNSSAVLFSSCTAQLGILSTDLDSSGRFLKSRGVFFEAKSVFFANTFRKKGSLNCFGEKNAWLSW